MEMKDIALKLCNLPKGEYDIKTKLDVKIQNIRSNERNDFRTVKIFINNELYDEIIYSSLDYFHIWENIYKNNNGQKYILKREILENKNEIKYTDKNGEVFYINNKGINNYNDSTLAGPSYIIHNGIFARGVKDSDNFAFIYNLENDKKLLYIRKNNKDNYEDNKNLITIKGDIKSFISKYNALVSIINSNNSKIANDVLIRNFTNGLSELVESYKIPTIDIEKVEKLDKEIDKYVNIYKEYAPKLNEAHSPEILEVLNMIATDLDDIFNTKMDNKETYNNQKKFNLSKYKNK